jgi:hypothetical protein
MHDARKRGRKPDVGNRIRDAMRKDLLENRHTVQQLKDMKEEEMAATYGGSRDTCRNARRAILSESEFVENVPD